MRRRPSKATTRRWLRANRLMDAEWVAFELIEGGMLQRAVYLVGHDLASLALEGLRVDDLPRERRRLVRDKHVPLMCAPPLCNVLDAEGEPLRLRGFCHMAYMQGEGERCERVCFHGARDE